MSDAAATMSRRGFVRAGVALSALSGSPAAWSLAAGRSVAPVSDADGQRAPQPQPFRILIDRTLPNAGAFAALAAGPDAKLLPIGSDPGPAWMHVIEPRLRLGPVALAGLTTGATLFCLEYLCRDYGLRPFRRADGGNQPTRAWIANAALSMGDTTEAQPLDLIDLTGSRSQSVFAWLMGTVTSIRPSGERGQ